MALTWRQLQEREQQQYQLLQEQKRAVGEQPPASRLVIDSEALEVRSAGSNAQLNRGVALSTFRYGQWSQPINLQQAAREGIRASAVIYRCAMAVASAAASLDVAVQTAGAVEYDFASQIPVLFNKRPNPSWTAAMYKLLLWLHLELVGQHFAYLERGPTGLGEPEEIWPIFDPVELVVDDRSDPLRPFLLGARVLHNQGALGITNSAVGGITALLPSELLWLRYPDPADPWGCLSPLRAAAWDADLDNYARQWQAGEFRNGSAPPGVIYLGDVSDEQYNQIVAGFEARQTGPMNARRMMFTSGPIQPNFVPLGLTAVEMSYLQSREMNAVGIMRAFGVSKDLLDGAATYANRREAKIHLWTETILPKLQIVESEIDRQFLPEDAQRALFDVRRVDALKENADSISNRASNEFKTGFILLDEAREKVGYPPLPDGAGQKLFVPRGAQSAAEAEVGALPPPGEEAQAANEGQGASPDDQARAAIARSVAQPSDGHLVDLRDLIPAERRRAAVQRLEHRHSAAGERALRRLGEKQRAVVLRAIVRQRRRAADVRAQTADLFDEPYWRDQAQEGLREWLTQLHEAAGELRADLEGVSFEALGEEVTQAIEVRLGELATRITEATREAIEAAAAGDDSLSERLPAMFEELAEVRSRELAAEVTHAFGGLERCDVVTDASGQNRPPLIEVHVHQGEQRHDIHFDQGSIHAGDHHMHLSPRVDARTTVNPPAVTVEAPKPAKKLRVTDSAGKTTTLERSDG